MGRLRLRKLLWCVLVTNLVTNVTVLAILVVVVYGYFRLNAPTEEPLSSGSYDASFSDAGSDPSGTEEELDPGKDGVLGIHPADWERLLAGEALRELHSEKGLVEVRIRFLVRASPRAVYDLLVDPDNLVELYDDVDEAVVKKSFRGENAAYDTIWFRGQNGPYEMEYCLRRDYVPGRSIRWNLVRWPGTSTLLKSCRGGWLFLDAGAPGVTLLDYRNQIQLPDLPDWLLTRMVEHNLPHTMNILRGRLESSAE